MTRRLFMRFRLSIKTCMYLDAFTANWQCHYIKNANLFEEHKSVEELYSILARAEPLIFVCLYNFEQNGRTFQTKYSGNKNKEYIYRGVSKDVLRCYLIQCIFEIKVFENDEKYVGKKIGLIKTGLSMLTKDDPPICNIDRKMPQKL